MLFNGQLVVLICLILQIELTSSMINVYLLKGNGNLKQKWHHLNCKTITVDRQQPLMENRLVLKIISQIGQHLLAPLLRAYKNLRRN